MFREPLVAFVNGRASILIRDYLVVPIRVAINALKAKPPDPGAVFEAFTQLELEVRIFLALAPSLERSVLVQIGAVGVEDAHKGLPFGAGAAQRPVLTISVVHEVKRGTASGASSCGHARKIIGKNSRVA